MIPPGCLVMLTPVVVGVLFGTRTLAGVLAGALVSGVQMAVSMSNTGSAWDNAKKYVEVQTSKPMFVSKMVPSLQLCLAAWCCVALAAPHLFFLLCMLCLVMFVASHLRSSKGSQRTGICIVCLCTSETC